jgi:hypothetical protein
LRPPSLSFSLPLVADPHPYSQLHLVHILIFSELRNKTQSTPLHFAAHRRRPHLPLLRLLIATYPGALTHRNSYGLLPFHCAGKNYTHIHTYIYIHKYIHTRARTYISWLTPFPPVLLPHPLLHLQ